MEGSRLILKRKRPQKSQKLFVALGIGVAACMAVMVLQMKTTLSERALTAVKQDVQNMRSQFDFQEELLGSPEGGVEDKEIKPVAEAPSAMDAFTSALEAAVKAEADAAPDAQVAGETTEADPVQLRESENTPVEPTN